jgi:hypothetical protein
MGLGEDHSSLPLVRYVSCPRTLSLKSFAPFFQDESLIYVQILYKMERLSNRSSDDHPPE